MRKFILLILAITLTFCSSAKKLQTTKELVPLTNSNNHILIGTYANCAINNNSEITSLWLTLDFNSKKYENWADLKVKLKIDDKNQLIAELIDGEYILKSKILKGKYLDNFYLLNQQYNTDFKYVVVWTWAESSVKLALTNEKNLLLLRKSGGLFMVVAFPIFAAESKFETAYKRFPDL